MENLIDILIPDDIKEGSESLFGIWIKNVGDLVQQHEPIAEVNTDKATVEICAPATGILKSINTSPESPVSSGMVIGIIELTEDIQENLKLTEKQAPNPDPSSRSTETPLQRTPHGLKISPAVQRLIQKHNINTALITGSGRHGRIRKADIAHLLPGASPSASSKSTFHAQPIIAKGRRVPHNQMRRRIAQHMQHSVQAAPHVTAVFDCNLSAIIDHRKRHRASFEQAGIQLNYTAYFVAASVRAIQEVPLVNSTWHDDCVEVFEDINIGVGTSLGDKGLVVPVVKNAHALTLREIAQSLTSLIGKAREGKISPEELSNGTFSISNHGVSGSLVASPIIIHQPQSAILGIGKLEKRAVVREVAGIDEITVQPMAYVTLTIDHRVIDAHQTNQFLTKFVSVIEHWNDPSLD
jgi:2-oxoglutarate dehydrogenase E2 component (dihydrolipoamide succinyltransferase)